MRVCDLKEEEVVIGLRIKSLAREILGSIVEIDSTHDNLAWIKWDDEEEPTSGFYGNDCECEVII